MTTTRVGEAWRNPRTWGPLGKGCRWCHENAPAAHGICRLCWVRCFHQEWIVIEAWIGRQAVTYTRQEARREALRLWREDRDPGGVIRYAEEYGVWLVPQKELNAD